MLFALQYTVLHGVMYFLHCYITLYSTITLHCIALLHYIVLHCYITLYCTVTLHCIVLLHYIVLHCYITLYCTVTLHCIALLHYSVLHCYIILYCIVTLYCITLVVAVDLFYISLFSIIEQTHFACMGSTCVTSFL